MKKIGCLITALSITLWAYCWGFYGHRAINYHSVFLLPPEMIRFYKTHIDFIREHAVDPDKRRYMIKEEAPRHYIDLDRYGHYPFDSLPRQWQAAIEKYSQDSLKAHGIVPWWIPVMQRRLVQSFKEKNTTRILKLSAELAHYIADAHVPLHTSSNHNGQLTSQHGIHGFWESRVPELLAESQWDFFIGRAQYITDISGFIWTRVLESAKAVDSVLQFEKQLTEQFSPDQKYAFEDRNGVLVRQYSSAFTTKYDRMLAGMIERRMRQSMLAVASCWYTAWVDAGQPSLDSLSTAAFSPQDFDEFEKLNRAWKSGGERTTDDR